MNGTRVGIAGVGLIGGSIAFRARAAGATVIGYDADSIAAQNALARGALDTLAPDLRSLAARCDTLVIALPVDATAGALAALAGVLGPELVIDVASVKGPLQPLGQHVPNYIGTHPLAGRERSGIAAADPALFERATWTYTPHADSTLVERVRAFITAMGAHAVPIDAARHDEIVALTSHVPQALSVALGAEVARAAQADAQVIELCATGMLSMLRLAKSPATVWAPIITANAAPLARGLRSIARALVDAADGLDQGDSSSLMSYFETARGVTGVLEERFLPVSRL